MKFSVILFSAALIAGAAAQSTTVTTTVAPTTTVSTPPIPTSTNSSYGPEVDACLDKCEESDVKCRATCLDNPNPTEEQVNETTKCYAACPQGNGTQAETEAYAKCQRECTIKYFLPNSSNVPNSNPTNTDGTDAPVGTDDEGNPTTTNGNGDSTTTGGTTDPSSDGDDGSAASTTVYSASFGSIIAAFAVFFAL